MEGGLVDIDDLIIGPLLDHRPKLDHEVHLLLLQLLILRVALPELVVGLLVLHPMSDVVLPQGAVFE